MSALVAFGRLCLPSFVVHLILFCHLVAAACVCGGPSVHAGTTSATVSSACGGSSVHVGTTPADIFSVCGGASVHVGTTPAATFPVCGGASVHVGTTPASCFICGGPCVHAGTVPAFGCISVHVGTAAVITFKARTHRWDIWIPEYTIGARATTWLPSSLASWVDTAPLNPPPTSGCRNSPPSGMPEPSSSRGAPAHSPVLPASPPPWWLAFSPSGMHRMP